MTDSTVGQEFVAGGFGGMAGVVAGHPLDTLKVHMQQPPHPCNSSHRPPQSTLSLIRHISAVNGPSAFFKGMGPPLASVPLQNAVIFQSYAMFSRALFDGTDGPPSYQNVAMAGIGAGVLQTSILTPVELIKIRLQLYSSNTKHAIGPLALARLIIKKEGVQGLYKGQCITALRDIPAFAVYFSSYEAAREWLHPGCRKTGDESLATMVTAGGIAGVASWISCYPMDVIKSRLQASEKYTGVMDCLRTSVKEEGHAVLWRGLGPTLARAYIVNGAIFSAYELSMRLMLSHRKAPAANTTTLLGIEP